MENISVEGSKCAVDASLVLCKKLVHIGNSLSDGVVHVPSIGGQVNCQLNLSVILPKGLMYKLFFMFIAFHHEFINRICLFLCDHGRGKIKSICTFFSPIGRNYVIYL